MPLDLTLRTGKTPERNAFIKWDFTKADDGSMTLCFAGRRADFRATEWRPFVEVVKQLAPSKWQSDKPIPELTTNPEARQLLRGCVDTVTFQMMLAGVDIVHAFKIVDAGFSDDLLRDFGARNHTLRSAVGPSGIYFVPSMLFQDAENDTIDQLLLRNKLCEATLTVKVVGVDNDPTRYYIPYAVPSTLETNMSPQANELWQRIRTEYYAFRYPLPPQPG